MNNFTFRSRDGSTPLEPDQIEGLKYSHITTMAELDEVEDLNIQQGLDWLNHQSNCDFLTISFLNKLHKKLFGEVWKWAGSHRIKLVNLSKFDRYHIGPELKKLFEDTRFWVKHEHMDWNEISATFHHRLVSIHPFPNGNGRTARIMTEFLQKQNGQKITSWKNSLENSPDNRRNQYIQSLKKADDGDYKQLIEFVKEKL